MQQLGEILIAEGVLTEHQLMEAIDEQRAAWADPWVAPSWSAA